jgi:hypothetical protein
MKSKRNRNRELWVVEVRVPVQGRVTQWHWQASYAVTRTKKDMLEQPWVREGLLAGRYRLVCYSPLHKETP